MNYRIATAVDGPPLAELRWEFRTENDEEKPAVTRATFVEAYVRFFQAGLKEGRRVHWMAEEDGRMVGHLVLQVVDLIPRPCKLVDRSEEHNV